MRALIQRVKYASVDIEGECIAEIEQGLLVLLGVHKDDPEDAVDLLVRKCAGLRIFEDADGKMNLSCRDISGQILLVPNFTLYADARRGNRPSFINAEQPARASALFDLFFEKLQQQDVTVRQGVFGADMKVRLLNDGPITILLDSDEMQRKA